VKKILETLSFLELDFPKELTGGWFYFVFFKNHEYLDGIACLYFNDKYPSGSVYVGDYIFNEYPDVYATWTKKDESGNMFTDRMHVSPFLRKNKIGTIALFYGIRSLKYLFDKEIIHKYGNELGNKMYYSAKKIFDPDFNGDHIHDTATESADLRQKFYDNPIYPYVFFGKRVSS